MNLKKIILVLLIIIFLIILTILGINFYVTNSTQKQIITESEYSKLEDIDCILILGCGIWDNKPSPMLEDRLNQGISLYKKSPCKIIMSGDHGKEDYDEVNVMKKYAIDNGVESSDIFMDHAGFSTYESIYRAKEIFGVKRIIIITQKYHLYRALYISNNFDIEAYGINSDPRQYAGRYNREIREVLARNKDFITCIFKPSSTYLGESIPVSGNGDVTNDKKNS